MSFNIEYKFLSLYISQSVAGYKDNYIYHARIYKILRTLDCPWWNPNPSLAPETLPHGTTSLSSTQPLLRGEGTSEDSRLELDEEKLYPLGQGFPILLKRRDFFFIVQAPELDF